MQFHLDIKSLLDIVNGWIGVVTFLTPILLFLGLKIRNGVKAFSRLFDTVDEIKQSIDKDIMPAVKLVKTELQTNGGSSIKDSLKRLEDKAHLQDLRWKLSNNREQDICVFECNALGNCVTANRALCDLYGLNEEDMLGLGWLIAVKETDRQSVWSAWQATIKSDIPYDATYTVVNQKTGAQFLVRAKAVVHRGLQNNILGYYGTVENISFEKEIQHGGTSPSL